MIRTMRSCVGLVVGVLVVIAAGNVVAAETFSYFRAIDSPAETQSGEPFLFATPSGVVYLSWIEKTGENSHRMQFSTLDGESWSAPSTIAQGTDWFVNWADVPSITANDDGRVAAHWLQKNGAGTYSYGVRISQSADGGKNWGRPAIPHTAGEEAEHGFVSMFFTDDALLVAWIDGRKFVAENPVKEMTVRAARISSDGSVGTSVEVDGRACDCCPMDFAVVGERAFLAYRDRSFDEIRDVSLAEFDVKAEFNPRVTTLYNDNWKIAGCPVNGPALAVYGETIFVAWFTILGESPTVRFAVVDPSTGAARVPTRIDDGAPLGRVDVVAIGERSALVSWIEETDDGAEIRIRFVGSDGWAGSSQLITTTSAARSSGYPRIVRAGDRIIAAWTDPSDPPRVRTASAKLSALTKKIQQETSP